MKQLRLPFGPSQRRRVLGVAATACLLLAGVLAVALAVDVPQGKPIESIEPAMVSVMKAVIARLL